MMKNATTSSISTQQGYNNSISTEELP